MAGPDQQKCTVKTAKRGAIISFNNCNPSREKKALGASEFTEPENKGTFGMRYKSVEKTNKIYKITAK